MATSSAVSSDINVDTFATYSDALQAAALNTTRLAATSLPSDLSFHRSIEPALASDVDAFSERVLGLTSRLVRLASGKTGRVVEEEDDVVDEFLRNIVDSMDGMLESTDSALDVFLGRKKDPVIPIPAVPIDPRQSKPKKHQPARGRLDPALTHASHTPKPQLLFKHIVPNTDEAPYIPAAIIPHKWCAKVPLGYVFHDEKPSQDSEEVHDDVDEEERRKRAIHPYYFELTHPSYPDHVFNPPTEPSPPSPMDISSSATTSSSHPLAFVSTPNALLALANTISSATEIAIDLEHHSYRSYRGFLALMQISTRQADFVVDLLVPEMREGLRQAKGKGSGDSEGARMANEAGQIIARVFADPSVIKVFHGAESDIVWLQQDFNLFVVGLFDTFHASKLLELPKHSLANLLETFCEFIPDKRYQLADWRIRPLPSEMLTYARSDTHFLLYIYDTLRLLLIEKASTSGAPPPTSDEGLPDPDTSTNPEHSIIHGVLIRSFRTALRLYEVDVYDAESGTGPGGWGTLAKKWNKVRLVGSTSSEAGKGAQASQAAVYRAVHKWREQMAREEDESTRYVLSTHHIFLLAERMPTTIPELLSLVGGPGGASGSVPPVLKRRVGELVAVIKEAMDAITSNSGQERSVQDGSKDVEMEAPTVVDQPAAATSSTVQPTSESRLWVVGPSSTSSGTISVSRSSLFGMGVASEQVQVQPQEVALSSVVGGPRTYSASSSVLFGGALAENSLGSLSSSTKSTFTSAQISNTSTERFRYLVEKIHKALVIAPVVSLPAIVVKTQPSEPSLSNGPNNANTYQANSTTPLPSDPIPPGPAGQIEIPFVPAHKRQTRPNPETYTPLEDDTIAVVGQPGSRQRKRKRDKTKGVARISPSNPGAGSGVNESSGDQDREMEEFDYSSVPNLLDSESKAGDERGGTGEEDRKKKKKQRQAKGSGLFDYGDFRAPPRDQREVKSGNKTHTFR